MSETIRETETESETLETEDEDLSYSNMYSWDTGDE